MHQHATAHVAVNVVGMWKPVPLSFECYTHIRNSKQQIHQCAGERGSNT